MTTKDYRPKVKVKVKEAEKNALVLRLERNQKDLSQLRAKLSSYLCEPKTYSLFERIEALRHSMDSLNKTNSETIYALKERKKTIDAHVARAKYQFSEFQRVHAGVEEYLTNCLSR